MGTIDDVVSTMKGGVTNLAQLALGMTNAYPPAVGSASPAAYGFNAMTTTAVLLLSNSTVRHGLIFHNPGTANMYVFPTTITTTPTTAAVGGAFLILPGATLSLPSTVFPNANCSWSGFAGTGSSQALTVVEFF